MVRPLLLLLQDLRQLRLLDAETSRTNPVTWLGSFGNAAFTLDGRAVPLGHISLRDGTGSDCGKVRSNLLALVTSRLRSRPVEEEFWVRRDALEEEGPAL